MQIGVGCIFPRQHCKKVVTFFAPLKFACAKRRANQYREASIVFVLPSIGAILDRPVAILLHMACEHVAEQLYFLEVAIKKLAQVGQADVQIVCGKNHIIFWYQPSIPRTSSELAITFTLYQPSFPTPQRNLNRWSEEMAS